MKLTTVSLRQLGYLRAVADGVSFAEAADELRVSQSALSQGLARLESQAGVPLFEADGRRRRLTQAGETMAAYARRVLADTDRVRDALRASDQAEAGTLRLAMIDAAALYLLGDAVDRFRAMRPGVDVRITVAGSDDCLERLAAFAVDVAVVVGPAPGFATTLVAEEPLYLFGRSGTPAAPDPWVLYPSDSHTRALIDQALGRRGLAPLVVGESGNPSVLGRLAVLMGAWTVLPGVVGTEGGPHLRRGAHITERSIVVATRPESREPLAAAFVDLLAGP